MKFVVENESNLVEKVYEAILPDLKAGRVFGLQGDLGAGKTTLMKGLAKKLKIKTLVTSPTFSIVKRYHLDNLGLILAHLDLYRFEKSNKSDEMEIIEILSDDQAISFVEWPERLKSVERIMTKLIKIKQIAKNKREVEIVTVNN